MRNGGYGEYNANNLASIIRAIKQQGTPKHLCLIGYTAKLSKQYPFAVRVYGMGSADISETVEHEQPYRHYLGVYTGEVNPGDLADDIAEMIAEKYRVRV
jgi:hypothetical protein